MLRNRGFHKLGVVEGREVGDILLDTGCSRTLVREDLVSAKKFLAGEAVAIRCAEVEIEVGGQSLKVEVAVLGTLPMAVLLGTDVPELAELLGGSQRKCGGRRLRTDGGDYSGTGEAAEGRGDDCPTESAGVWGLT